MSVKVNQKLTLQSFLLVCILSANASNCCNMELKILSVNIEMDGIAMDDPGTELAQIILDSGADIVIFAESKTASLLDKIFSKIGDKWTGARAGSSAVLSRMPLGVLDEQQNSVINVGVGDVADHGGDGSAYNGADGITVLVDVDENGSFDRNSLIVSAIHPNSINYAAYLPRGYDGLTFETLPNGPITEVAKIQEVNKRSMRKDQVTEVLTIIKKYEAIFKTTNITSIIAGDFNEPSGFDWSDGLKNHFGHNGVVYDWETTRLLRENGYIDTFHNARLKKCGVTGESPQNEIDACIIKHPGFTWQSLPPKNMEGHWAENADDRDRIDFIFIRPSNATIVEVKNSVIVGDNYYYGYYDEHTSGNSISKIDDPSSGTVDDFLTLGYPTSEGQHFPSDHRGVLTTVDLSRACSKPSPSSENGASIHNLMTFYFYLFIIFAYLF